MTNLSDPNLSPQAIEYKVSAPALHAARALAMNFDIIERADGEIPYCDHNIAVLIDVHTSTFRVKETMKRLFTSGEFYYPDVNSLQENLEALQHHISEINELRSRLPRFENAEADHLHDRLGIENRPTPGTARDAELQQVSAAALNAIRQLMLHFVFVEKASGVVPMNERAMAHLIDLCTEANRVEYAMNELCARTGWQSKDELRRNLQVVRKCLHAVDVAQMRMPSYGKEMGAPLWRSASVEVDDPASNEFRRRRAEQIQMALRSARNPEQAARILHSFGG